MTSQLSNIVLRIVVDDLPIANSQRNIGSSLYNTGHHHHTVAQLHPACTQQSTAIDHQLDIGVVNDNESGYQVCGAFSHSIMLV